MEADRIGDVRIALGSIAPTVLRAVKTEDVLRGMREAFPDMRWVLQEQVAEGDKVVTRFEWTGTHRGPFLGVAATGRSVRVWGIVIDRLDGGKLKESRMLMDTLGLMAQLGQFPPPAGAG